MKFTAALLTLAGLASAADVANSNAKSFADLGDGTYTVPIVNGTLHYAGATRHLGDGNATAAALAARDADQMPGKCVPQFPTRKTVCRTRDIRRADYLRAYSQFLQWIETGPDDGWVERGSCKSVVAGLAVVSACSKAGKQPTCVDEVAEAMREIDEYCAEEAGGDIKIRRWAKIYSRHNVRDGDGLGRLLEEADGEDADEGGHEDFEEEDPKVDQKTE
ncbi:hypothetical protein F4821DRAFT_252470 [Hypoxylon rubiginosum]|uniref:Uncharacterized protein n=1 Tax=Hypoxylon rubiginosum TaxID=110542 RepID=A0ACC0DL49_9PEZI|nr:hypothetical protein F4821DRAFT_252470 [Hypoxylon rubiginosum]